MVKIIKTFDMTQPQLMFQFCGTDNKSIHFSEWCADMMIHSRVACHHSCPLKLLRYAGHTGCGIMRPIGKHSVIKTVSAGKKSHLGS
jgi:hypothetical protein